MKIAAHGQHYRCSITWSKAKPLKEFQRRSSDEHANFYMWLGSKGKGRRLLYLGKTFRQFATWRLEQPDNKDRLAKIHRKYPYTRILISTGVISSPDRKRFTQNFIDEVESLLIYAHQPEFNDTKCEWVEIEKWYRVTSRGDSYPLKRIVYFGPAISGEED